ncbi:MAG: PhzF family phenazine biosynthesis protein, partial [Nitrospina sp.]|nr:PhzF family phenazine biosynthesis protein [Nitrospina sp.]
MNCSFYQVDVFTKIPFGGNPLAVVFDTEGLTSQNMQNIAREMNLSETTFVLPSDNLPADFSVRIFTPEKELPFAGHPTIGTAHILRETGKVFSGNYKIKLSMKVGIVTVSELRRENLLFMDQLLPVFH